VRIQYPAAQTYGFCGKKDVGGGDQTTTRKEAYHGIVARAGPDIIGAREI